MSYDYDYFSGKDLHYPVKPTKPRMGSTPTAAEARAYADNLEVYEAEMTDYTENKDWYNRQTNLRMIELHDRIRDDYDITEAQFNVLWRRAWEDGHSESLRRVVEIFDELYEMASEFAALEKD
jgi:hypothetical protein